ncbi:sulfite exporter TauE/SafE family protein [Rhodophyticola sp. CCM32]|uniref:sulfite exporter TauE/SafE family protein n=1 Tax=Rhodophyticola sp. CCM32 TaxID=2916397 RepID=UPI00107EEA9B|nr:sulfite exporter TauE/SafE family protein [Rhodophyticola sp. CCM32]QBX99555.1 sulfite exporter TauE/SafE family protein [Rhodophyticola sp. CCM32]
MPEALNAALALEGLVWILGATTLAGVVYGFAGFGSALIYMPLATIWLEPAFAIAAFSLSALVSLFTVVPRAWHVAEKPAVFTLIGAAFVSAPLGIYLLRVLDVDWVRIAVAVTVLVTLAALMAGWRYATRPGFATRLGVGAATGVLGGLTGLMGPIVILFNLGAGARAEVMRANTLIFLTLISILVLPQMAAQGILSVDALWLGVVMMPVYALGTRIGQMLFNPRREALYRQVAYGIIALAGVMGLPVWQ